jgi:hypothetical protein
LTKAIGNGHQRARDLFRLGHPTGEAGDTADRRCGKTLAGLADDATDHRALVVALGIVLVAYEDTWSTDTWRRPSTADARYLMFLMTNGYTPAEVEQLVLGASIPASRQRPETGEAEVQRRRPSPLVGTDSAASVVM